jgi:hypothetical protein
MQGTSGLDACELLPSSSGRFTPGETARGTHFIGGWVDLRVGVDAVEKRKKFLPLPGVEPILSNRCPLLHQLSYAGSLHKTIRFYINGHCI